MYQTNEGCFISCLAFLIIVVFMAAIYFLFYGTIAFIVVEIYNHIIAPSFGLPPLQVR